MRGGGSRAAKSDEMKRGFEGNNLIKKTKQKKDRPKRGIIWLNRETLVTDVVCRNLFCKVSLPVG